MGFGLLGIGFGLFLNKLSTFENFYKKVFMLLLETSQK